MHNLNDAYSKKLVNVIETAKASGASIDIEKMKSTIIRCKESHAEQKRNSGEPYFTHPIDVTIISMKHCPEEEVIEASLLHDAVEDNINITLEMIEEWCGKRVAKMVDLLTRVKKNGVKHTIPESLLGMYECRDKKTILVKIGDRIHNLITIGGKAPDKQKKVKDETMMEFLPYVAYVENIELEKELISLAMPTFPEHTYEDCY